MLDLDFGPGEILPPAETALASPSDALRQEVDGLLDSIHNQELRLATGYVRLGSALLRVRQGHHYEAWGFRSFGSYINSLRARIDRGRSQIYQVISVTEKLLPMIEAEVLEEIGISKAGELKRYVTNSLGQMIPAGVLDIARDPLKGIDELRAAVFEALHQKPDPKGRYYDLGGFFCTPDEKAEIDNAFNLACRVDPVIPQETPEPQRRLEIMLRLSREFVSTYGAIV